MAHEALIVYTAPTVEPVGLSEAKLHLRIEETDTEEDSLLEALITAARQTIELVTWRALCTQTLDLVLDEFPSGDTLELPRPPLVSVTSISYTLEAGTTSTLSTSVYGVDTDSEPGRLYLKPGQSWPSDSLYPVAGVRIRYVAGYGNPGDVPRTYRQALLLLVGHWYENREQSQVQSMSELPFGVQALLGMDHARRFL